MTEESLTIEKLIELAHNKLNVNNYEVPVNSIYYEIIKLIQEDEDVKSQIEKKIKHHLEYIKYFKEEKEEEEEVSKDKWGVHESHCCKEHGCKYGYEKCPVVLGYTKQRHPCMDCE